jgi:thioredoxin
MVNSHFYDVDDSSFDREVRGATSPVVIDFWAPWCQPCRVIHPILERMAAKYGDSVKFFRMNVDEARTKPAEYAVRGIPTLLFFKNGAIKNQLVGVQSENTIEEAVRGLL